MGAVQGLFRLQYFFDAGEEIGLDQVRALLNLGKPGREPGFRQRTPEYVRFERPPVEERLGGEKFPTRLRYFEYGVVSLEFEIPFDCAWDELTAEAAKWVGADEPEAAAEQIVRRRLDKIAAGVRKPAPSLLKEDYTVIELRGVGGADGAPLTSSQLLTRHGDAIAQIVRGETTPLSETERSEVLASSMCYSPLDALVVGYAAALVYDQQPNGADPTRQLLEYANTQLLEYRHYDELLTRVLSDAYERFAQQQGPFRHWRTGREAKKLNALRLEVMELTERTDNAIKFLSDMFYARAYKLASARIGVPDYRRLVDEKLRTAGELYRFMMDDYHQGRAFIMELTIVIILIIDLVVLFTGKP
jgi:hypothetical protein